MFVFRNNTVERFFPKGYSFSGYDDISNVPPDENGYVWFYQLPIKYNTDALTGEISSDLQKFEFVLAQIPASKPFIALTIGRIYSLSYTEKDEKDLTEAIDKYNLSLLESERKYGNVKVLDINEFYAGYPASELLDWKYYFISQMGMNPRLSNDFQKWWQRKMDGIAMKRIGS